MSQKLEAEIGLNNKRVNHESQIEGYTYLSNFMNEMLEGERSVGGCGCDVVAVLSANKTKQNEPHVVFASKQGWSCVET